MSRKFEPIQDGLNPYTFMKLNKDFEYLFQGAERVSDLSDKADATLQEAQQVNAQNTDTNERLDNIIADSGTSSTEVVDARGLHTVLSGRLEYQEKRTRKEKEHLRKNMTVASTRSVPMVTFLDDDTRNNVYYRLKPIFEPRGVPLSMACISGRFDDPKHLTLEQLRELYGLGWEVLGHSYTHPTGTQGLMEYAGDYSKLEYEIGEGCKDLLEDLGFEMNGFVYPQSGHNFDIREITKNHYTYAFGGIGFNGDKLMDSMEINRIAFGLSSDLNPTVNGNNEKNTLAYYKECVDYAISNNLWLVFMVHVSAQTVEEDQILADLIDYIQSVDVPIVNAKEGYETHGNRYFAGDVQTNNYTIIDKNNKMVSSGLRLEEIPSNSKSPSEKLSTYPPKTITYMRTTNSFASEHDLPSGVAGFLVTHRLHDSDVSYSKQEYIPYTNPDTYTRTVNPSTGEWGEFYATINSRNLT